MAHLKCIKKFCHKLKQQIRKSFCLEITNWCLVLPTKKISFQLLGKLLFNWIFGHRFTHHVNELNRNFLILFNESHLTSVVIGILLCTVNCLVQLGQATADSVSIWMGDCISMSISFESPLGETLNRGPWRCTCGNSINFPFGLYRAIFIFF